MPILKLDKEDENKKIQFELDYLCSLTTLQRFQAMLSKTEEIRKLLGPRAYRKTVEVIKRK